MTLLPKGFVYQLDKLFSNLPLGWGTQFEQFLEVPSQMR